MKNFIFLTFLIAFFAGCSSTTQGGIVGENRSQLMLVSEASMNENSKVAYTQFINQAKQANALNKNKAQTQRVQKITKRLIKQVGVFREDAAKWDWQVNVITSKEVNAWCMPGGKIAVYTGIIDTLKLNDAEIAAIVGHEMAHALREHSREQASHNLISQIGIEALSIFGLGNFAGVANAATNLGVHLPYSRTNEYEADRIGTELMARAGYNPNNAVHLWEKMIKLNGNGGLEIMSTHPNSENRIKNLKSIVKDLMPVYEKTKI